jgi:hypothetical protein
MFDQVKEFLAWIRLGKAPEEWAVAQELPLRTVFSPAVPV